MENYLLKLKNTEKDKENLHSYTTNLQKNQKNKTKSVIFSLSPLDLLKKPCLLNKNIIKRGSSIHSNGGLVSYSNIIKKSCKSLKEIYKFPDISQFNEEKSKIEEDLVKNKLLTINYQSFDEKEEEYESLTSSSIASNEENDNEDNEDNDEKTEKIGTSNENQQNKSKNKSLLSNNKPKSSKSITTITQRKYYSEEDKFINELSEDYKKYYIHSVDNCFGNYDVYVTNSLMLTTILPEKSYFKNEIHKKKIDFKISPFKKLMLLDLDETLIHCDFEYKLIGHSTYIKLGDDILPIFIRPYAKEFLEFSSKFFDIVIFTASKMEYAKEIIDYIDPSRDYIKMIIDRSHCIVYKNLYLKFPDLFDVPVTDVIIIDNSLFSFAYNLDNGILVTSYYDECDDQELLSIIEFLSINIVKSSDVRLKINEIFEFEHIKKALMNLNLSSDENGENVENIENIS